MAFTNSCLKCIGRLTRSGFRWLIASMTGRQITHNAELQSEGDGKESGRRCSLVVVPRSGEAVLFDLNCLSDFKNSLCLGSIPTNSHSKRAT